MPGGNLGQRSEGELANEIIRIGRVQGRENKVNHVFVRDLGSSVIGHMHRCSETSYALAWGGLHRQDRLLTGCRYIPQ